MKEGWNRSRGSKPMSSLLSVLACRIRSQSASGEDRKSMGRRSKSLHFLRTKTLFCKQQALFMAKKRYFALQGCRSPLETRRYPCPLRHCPTSFTRFDFSVVHRFESVAAGDHRTVWPALQNRTVLQASPACYRNFRISLLDGGHDAHQTKKRQPVSP